MGFYDIYEKLCAKRGVSPTKAAREIGVSQSVVSSWKIRGSTPKAETVQKLAGYFGVSVGYLLGDTGNPENGEKNEPDINGSEEMDPVKKELIKMLKGMDREQLIAIINMIKAMRE